MRLFFVGAVLMSIVGVSLDARADLPRPPGWEPTCVLEKEQQKSGGPCEQCRGWQDPDPCQKALENKGYTRRCTEGGAGSFVAVWCKSAAGAASTTETPAATTTTTTTTAAATNATNPSAPPPQVAPASDNRRGSGMCSIGPMGQDKPNTLLLACGLLAAAWGFRRCRIRFGQVNQ